MERKISAAALGGVVLLFLSCEAVFTTSLFEWAQRDPSKLSASGKVAYGQDALASGDRKAMARAYEALKDTGDTGLYPFVAELALGAAGVTQALRDLLGNIAAGTDQAGIHAALEAAFASFGPGDLALIQEAAVLIQDAEADAVTISATAGLVRHSSGPPPCISSLRSPSTRAKYSGCSAPYFSTGQ